MKKAIVFYFISEFFLSFGIGIVQYAQPFFYAAGHIGDEKIGYLFAANAFFGGCAALVAGPVADRVGASRMFKAGTLFIGLGDLGVASGHTFGVWLITSAIAGIGGSMLTSTENVVLSSLLVGRDRAHLISRFTAAYMFLIGAGIVCAGFMVAAFGLASTMWMGSLIALVAPVIRIFVKAPDARREKGTMWPSRPLLLMAGYAILFGIAGGLFNPFVTLILSEHYGATNRTTAIVYAVSIFMISLGAFLVRPLIERLRQQATLLLAFVFSVISTLLFVIATTTAAFVVLYFVVTVTTAVPPPIIDAMFLDFVHASAFSQMFGMRVFGIRLGNAIGSALGGGLLKRDAYNWVMCLAAIFFVMSYIYLRIVRRLLRNRAAAGDVIHGATSD